MIEQLELFGGTTPPSTSIVNLLVALPRPCPSCGSHTAITGSSAGPHAARLDCAGCGRHAGWMSAETRAFIEAVIDVGGRPESPIIIRRSNPENRG
jgi:hypothetical protein